MPRNSVLITGATGILGSWILGEALSRGYAPIALMRDRDHGKARARLQAVLGLVGQGAELDRVRIVLGDARRPNLGLDTNEASDLVSGLDLMVHCAASTSFDPGQDDDVWTTNVGGVENLLRFLDGKGVLLYHVSSAYVAGRRQGRVLETELEAGQQFRNTYERSKCASERLVHDAIADGRVQGAVFRPSIIAGASDTGTIAQFMNFYQFLRLIDMTSRGTGGNVQTIRMEADPAGTKNLVPVDWCAKALWAIVDAEGPSAKTYHLTNPAPETHLGMADWANTFLEEQNGIRLDVIKDLDNTRSRLESVYHRAIKHYLPYLEREPDFDRTNTDRALGGRLPFPETGPTYLDAIIGFAREQRWRGVFQSAPAPQPEHEAKKLALATNAAQ
jgi:thioester reductase-like protein